MADLPDLYLEDERDPAYAASALRLQLRATNVWMSDVRIRNRAKCRQKRPAPF